MEASASSSKPHPEEHAPPPRSQRSIPSLSNPNHQAGHCFPLLPKPLSAGKTHTNTGVRDLSQPCLWVVRRAQPSPAFPCEANANPQGCGRFCFFFFFSKKTLSPAAAHYLWQLFLDLKWVLKPCCQLPSCHPAIL